MSAFLSNLSSPPLLFFFLGIAAIIVRSDLRIPAQIAKFLSIYLLFAIGFKGGVALSQSDLNVGILLTLLSAMALSAVVPLYTFVLMRRKLPIADAAAVAATYGSVSAVTFVTAAGYLDVQGIDWGGYLVAAMALMESPAIIVGILLYSRFGDREKDSVSGFSWKQLLNESLFNSSVFLILGSMMIGWITGENGMTQVEPLVKDLFLGMLCLFLLDMGIVAAGRLRDFSQSKEGNASGQVFKLMLTFGTIMPFMNALLGLGVAQLLGLPEGDALLFVVLTASASYIAVPAAMRLALPEANPACYLTMSLAITFPVKPVDRYTCLPRTDTVDAMKPCKRIEIVIESPLVPSLIEHLQALNVPGYTVIPEVPGAGDRGVRRADDLSGESSNSIVIIACDNQSVIEQLLESVRGLIHRSGGICLVSDAQWLRH